MGMTRRLNHYDNPAWHPWLIAAAFGAVLIAIGIGCQLLQLFVSIRDRNLPENRDLTGDPWDGHTLEWATSSPPPAYNFAHIPDVRSLDAFTEMKSREGGVKVPVYRDIHMPSNTSAGLLVGLFSLVLGFAGVWHIWWLAIVGFVGAIATVIIYSFQDNEGYYIPADTVALIEEKRSGGAAAVAGVGARADAQVTLEVD
jgi:cytochrome o ubiquinol oxidase subunit 1